MTINNWLAEEPLMMRLIPDADPAVLAVGLSASLDFTPWQEITLAVFR